MSQFSGKSAAATRGSVMPPWQDGGEPWGRVRQVSRQAKAHARHAASIGQAANRTSTGLGASQPQTFEPRWSFKPHNELQKAEECIHSRGWREHGIK